MLIQLSHTGGSVEAGTDHARAGNLAARGRHDLICKPWCLFNLTADIGPLVDTIDIRSACHLLQLVFVARSSRPLFKPLTNN